MGGAAVDRHVLADHGPLPDRYGRLFARILEVLRRAPENASDSNFDERAQSNVAVQRGARSDDAAVANGASLSHDRESADLDVRSDLRVR